MKALVRGVLSDISADEFDDAADAFVVSDLRGRVPPITSRVRRSGGGAAAVNGNTLIRLASASVCRMSRVGDVDVADVADSETFFLYHSALNALTYRSAPFQRLEIARALEPAVRAIIRTFPRPIRIKQLPKPRTHHTDDDGDGDGDRELSGSDLLNVRHLMLELLKHKIIVVMDGVDDGHNNDDTHHEPMYANIALQQLDKLQ